MKDSQFNLTAGKSLIGELFCYFSLAFFLFCVWNSLVAASTVFMQPTVKTVQGAEHNTLVYPTYFLPCEGPGFLPCFYSLLVLPSEIAIRKPLASGTWQVFVYFTLSPCHNPNKILQNSFRKQTDFPKVTANKNLSINPKKTQHSTHTALHVPEYIYKSNFLLLKIHLKTKNFVFCG